MHVHYSIYVYDIAENPDGYILKVIYYRGPKKIYLFNTAIPDEDYDLVMTLMTLY